MAVAQAFARHDADGSDSLDHSELMECIAELGLRPKTEEERSEVHRVVLDLARLHFSFKEFSTEILPEVRRRLGQLREPKVVALWREIEEASALGSTITVEDALTELGKRAVFLGPSAHDEALKTLAREIGHDERVLPVHRTWLDLERFRSLYRIVQERYDVEQSELFQRISKQHSLSQEDQETWRHELIELWRQFHENDPYRCRFGSPSGSLDDQQIAAVLRHSGYLQYIPRHMSKPLTVSNLVNKAVRSDRTLGFPQFLEVCHALREFDRERLRRLIDIHASGRSGVITRHELPDLLVNCGVVADDAVCNWEVAAEIEDCGLGGSGSLSREDVVVLSQRISLKPRAVHRELERQYMVAVGWSAERVAECRRAFEQFDENMSDSLTESELFKAFEVGKGRYAPLVRDLDVAFLALNLDTSVEVRVDFLTFMRMMKMLDESEARRGMAAMLGFGDETSDKAIGIYQKLSDQNGFSNSGLPRAMVEQAMLGLLAQSQWIPKVQQAELQVLLGQEPATVDFGGLLRFMKALQGMIGDDDSFEECMEDILLGVDSVLSERRERTK
jgi:Ca2+-binding EF-hand superfamily protein